MLSKEAVVDDMDIEGILNSLRPGIDLFLVPDFPKLKKLLKSRPESYHHLFCLAMLKAADTAMTLDKLRFKMVRDIACKALEKSDVARKKNTSIISKTNGNDYTDEECHAELVYSELQGFLGCLVVVEDQSILGFVKGALRIRSCYNGYKECERILKCKANWRSDILREEFVAGVNQGLGAFELGVSFAPRKFVILLELAGFSSNRASGLEKLTVTANCTTSFRKYAGMSAIAGYHLFIGYFYGLGELKPETQVMLKNFVHHVISLNNKSDYAVGFHGVLALLSGNFEAGESFLNKFMNQKSTPQAAKYAALCYKIWVSTFLGKWEESLESARMLKECKWSRSLFCFMYAVQASLVIQNCRLKGIECPSGLEESMMEALRDVPRCKRHFGGKMTFHEKIVITKAAEFLEDPSKMVLPHLDLMYLWNLFSIANWNTGCITLLKDSIDRELTNLSNEKDIISEESQRIHSYLTFMRGIVDSVLGLGNNARDSFLVVIEREGNLTNTSFRYLIPQSYFELGMLYRRAGDFVEARKWFKKTRTYSEYITESMITFRVDWALKSMAEEEAKLHVEAKVVE